MDPCAVWQGLPTGLFQLAPIVSLAMYAITQRNCILSHQSWAGGSSPQRPFILLLTASTVGEGQRTPNGTFETRRAGPSSRHWSLQLHTGHVREAYEPVDKRNSNRANRTAAMFRHDQLCRSPVRGLRLVDLIAIDEDHNVTVLLDPTALT